MNNFIIIIDSIIASYNEKNSNIQLNYSINKKQEYNTIKLSFTIKEDTNVLFSSYIKVEEEVYKECEDDVNHQFQMRVIKDLLRYSLEYLKLINTKK